jgi:hypothetical protein
MGIKQWIFTRLLKPDFFHQTALLKPSESA